MIRRWRMLEDLDQQIRDHVEQETLDNIARGLSPEDARHAALRKFGNVLQVKEDARAVWTPVWLEQVFQDARYGLRMLRRSPGFTAVAVLSLAFGIGANAAIFSFADALLLRPLPVPDASDVVTVVSRTPAGGFGRLSYPDFVDFRDKTRSFDGLVAYDLIGVGLANDSRAQPRLKMGFLVSRDFFRMLGVEPHMGRGFSPDEERVPGRDAVMILAYEVWKHEFAADPSVIGRRLRLNGVDFSVVGVTPESFTGLDQYVRPAFFIPVMMGPTLLASNRDILTDRSARAFGVKARLKRGESIQAANTEAGALAQSLEQSHPETNRAYGAAVRTELQARMDDDSTAGPLQGLLLGIVMVLLVIACANVANLMLSRGRSRAREVALRLAIGASRWRLVRQLMVESLLMACAGGVLGLLIAAYAVSVFSTFEVPGDVPVVFGFQLDGRVLTFTALVSVASAVLFGLVPAFQSTRTDLVSALKTGESDQTRTRFFGRQSLVVAQVAGSLVLLVVATQLARGFLVLLAADPGFRTDHLITMRVDPTLAGYSPARIPDFYKTLTERARAVPGVKSAALTFSPPMIPGFMTQAVIPEGHQFPRGVSSTVVFTDSVDDHYFETLGVGMVQGRGFLSTDRAGSPAVAVVNETFATRYLGPRPLGRRIWLNDEGGRMVEVVGVTVPGKHMSIFEPPVEFMYLPLSQHPRPRVTLVAETEADPAAMAAPLREMVRSIDPNVPIFSVRTMADLFEQRSVRVAHLIIGIVGSVGVGGLFLALVGLYAVVAYQVSWKTHEIGIRMALGAARRQVLGMIVKQAAIMGVTGVAIGMALSFASRGALTMGAGLPGFDRTLFSVVAATLLATMMLAAVIPARRAARIEPMQALRQD